MENLNSARYLEGVRADVMAILDALEIAPSAQIHTGQIGTTQIPPPFPVTSQLQPQSAGEDTAEALRENTGRAVSRSEFY